MADESLTKAPVFSDARALTKDTLPKAIDILVAGLPCVDGSQAGLKEVWKGQIQHWCFMRCVSHARWPCRWCSWRTSKVGWPVAPCVWWAGPYCLLTLVRPSTCIVTAIDSAATGGSHTLFGRGLDIIASSAINDRYMFGSAFACNPTEDEWLYCIRGSTRYLIGQGAIY